MNDRVGRWLKAAGVRALKTGAQTLASLIGTGAVGILALDWPQMLSVTATAMVLSLLTSVAGLPELDEEASNEPTR
jgi:zinc transporter ZupT